MADKTITLPPSTVPHAVAQAFVALHYFHEGSGRLTLIRWRGDFYAWRGTCYMKVPDDQLRAELYALTAEACFDKDDERKPWAPNTRKISDVLDALKAVCREPDELQPPCRLDGHARGVIVPCANGLLDVTTREMLEHSPLFFNLSALSFDYDPQAKCPEWDAFMKQLWHDDEEPVWALEEFLGCIVAGKTDMQRILALIGPPRSGKGTIFAVAKHLVGPSNSVSTQLLKLTNDNTLSSLIGKSVCLIPDMRATGGKVPQIAEVLLSISGQDDFTIDRKYRDPWTGSLTTLIFMAGNELPAIRDAAGALPKRYLPIVLTESFEGREDRGLQTRLLAELPGILNQALHGLEYVIKKGRFTEPKASAEAVEDMTDMASPALRFTAEHIAVMPKGEDPAEYTTPVADLHRVYQAWARDNDEELISRGTFGQRLRAAIPTIKRSQPRAKDGERVSCYVGLRLRHRETETARARRQAFAEMAQRTKGGLRLIKDGSDDSDDGGA